MSVLAEKWPTARDDLLYRNRILNNPGDSCMRSYDEAITGFMMFYGQHITHTVHNPAPMMTSSRQRREKNELFNSNIYTVYKMYIILNHGSQGFIIVITNTHSIYTKEIRTLYHHL